MKFLKSFQRYPGRKQKGKSTYFKRGAPYNGILNSDWKGIKKENFIKAMIFPPLPPKPNLRINILKNINLQR